MAWISQRQKHITVSKGIALLKRLYNLRRYEEVDDTFEIEGILTSKRGNCSCRTAMGSLCSSPRG